MSSVDEILAKLEELNTKVGYLQADVHGLRQDIDDNQRESRHDITSLRSDLTLFANRFATAVDDAKKKATKTQTPFNLWLAKLRVQKI
jgi:outer membrane murein-binding lipoprotein Lpp